MLVLHWFRELEIDWRVVVVHAEADTVLNSLKISTHIIVGVCELMNAAECQQRFNLHTDILNVVEESVFDDQPVGIVLEKQRLLEIEFPDAVVIHRHAVSGEFLQIFVSFRVNDFILILVDA